ncbi:tubulin-tyrosine ligase family protein [Stylonychia lemnae]|uniref:Tubulin-tyrosine ligase family protein n=1 Tax=Stylonychia lemnae TaxID=5949 RepID=A0A077ZTV3_STYLE|nr:tubulin-tyrosine ligase family protein [Stylonychia lemnae]|eukprot:CDW72755.1 tubulin-tyrosine ligase family protein [Stylonychia lemnae]
MIRYSHQRRISTANQSSQKQIRGPIRQSITNPEYVSINRTQDNTTNSTTATNTNNPNLKSQTSLLQSRIIKKNNYQTPQKSTTHSNHLINQVIRYSNEFILETFIRPNDQPPNLERIRSICIYFGFKLPKNIISDPQQVKSKEFQIYAKERILQRLYDVINKENCTDTAQIHQQQQIMRKFYVGRGNNYQLVRSVFKQRWWWQLNPDEDFEAANFIWTSWRKNDLISGLKARNHKNEIWTDGKIRIYNKLEDNFHLSNKKALFFNMSQYYKLTNRDPFEMLPLTFHIEHGLDDPEFDKFKQYFDQIEKERLNNKRILEEKKRQYQQQHQDDDYDSEEEIDEEKFYKVRIPKNIWIMKPGENSNRGTGIFVCNTLKEIRTEITSSAKQQHTHIIQKYIERPLLINNRKFDIRVYGMLTSVNGNMKGYFYEDGYIRTSCKEFNLDNLQNRFIHLTNDAVQKKSDDYGKFENGNKVSYQNFQKYLDTNLSDKNISFQAQLLPQIKIDPHRRSHCFEIFGYDFMIDDEFRVYLIEANTNPCLELSCPLLARIIPAMLDSAFRLSIDPLFPPPDFNMAKKNTLHEIMPINKFELVFDERIEGEKLREILKNQEEMKLKIDANDEFEEESQNSDGSDHQNEILQEDVSNIQYFNEDE